jgi:hypothetical protein
VDFPTRWGKFRTFGFQGQIWADSNLLNHGGARKMLWPWSWATCIRRHRWFSSIQYSGSPRGLLPCLVEFAGERNENAKVFIFNHNP